jgi:Uma2 family endonuclease
MRAKLPAESRYEIISGKLIDRSPAPSPEHQNILKKIFRKMDAFVESQQVGEINFAPYDVILDQTNIVQPDIFFIAANNQGRITNKGFEGIPELTVEIISPSSFYRDHKQKSDLYERFGIKEYWLIDPANRVMEVFSLQNGKYALHAFVAEEGKATSALLEGFEVHSSDVFTSTP